jgi:ketosteroid isomerase-like protein
MSQNVESIRSFYEAWNRRDFDAALSDASPDFEIVPLRAMLQAPKRGHREARKFWAEFDVSFEEIRVEPMADLVEAGEMVIAQLHWWARGRDGIEVDRTMVDLWTFRDGMKARVEGFETKEEALEAAGLRE